MISEAEIDKAADELTDVIASTVARLADEVLGRPEFGTPEWLVERDRLKSNSEAHRAWLREWHLTKIRIERAAKVSMTGDVINARLHGASWADIGAAVGTSRQAAHERWGDVTPDPEPTPSAEQDTTLRLPLIKPPSAQLATFTADIARRCRWAVDHNDGHPRVAWATGEQLAVALVLADTDYLTDMGYTVPEAMERVAGGMLAPPRDMAKWITGIRATY